MPDMSNTDIAGAWDAHARWYQGRANLPTDVVHYGGDIGTEADFRLCGDVKGKRVLELGCGGAQCSIAFAKQGAIAIGVDFSAEQLAHARQLADQEGVKVELHESDVADLAFIRADTIDLAFSACALNYVEDLNRVFRQVHRVLKPNAALVFSTNHPAAHLIDTDADEPLLVRHSYWDHAPMEWEWNGVPFRDFHHTIQDVFTSLIRANFRIDTIIEPEPVPSGARSMFWDETQTLVPRYLIIRARKEGT
ncbi:MAG: class I SAM-dependent methyltransferase [Actinobacteria bacterium]|nr:MAG: class I SAM-dependent methyltransferase [Actinomycetota bacterium]